MTTYESRDEFERDLREYGRQDALADAADEQFDSEYAEEIADAARDMLIERCATDRELALAYLDYRAEFPCTHAQFVDMLRRTDCQLWSDALDEARDELMAAMEAQ